jgi:hypothetical protein
MRKMVSTLLAGLMLLAARQASPQGTQPPLQLTLSTDKTAYVLGEPVIASVRLLNVGDSAASAISRLGPEFGFVDYTIAGPQGVERQYRPVSVVNVRRGFRQNLAPGASVYDAAKVFYANTGWTFRTPGMYTITATYPLGQTAVTTELTIEVVAPPPEQQEAARLMLSNNQQGLLLYWEHGDHLIDGIQNLTQLAEQFPNSQLGAYANFGLGINLAKEFFNAATDSVRPADYQQAVARLTRALQGDMDSYFRVQAMLALGNSYIGLNDIENSRATLTGLLEEFQEDPRYEKQIGRARELLRGIG